MNNLRSYLSVTRLARFFAVAILVTLMTGMEPGENGGCTPPPPPPEGTETIDTTSAPTPEQTKMLAGTWVFEFANSPGDARAIYLDEDGSLGKPTQIPTGASSWILNGQWQQTESEFMMNVWFSDGPPDAQYTGTVVSEKEIKGTQTMGESPDVYDEFTAVWHSNYAPYDLTSHDTEIPVQDFLEYFPLEPGNAWWFYKPEARGGDRIILYSVGGPNLSSSPDRVAYRMVIHQFSVEPAGPVLTFDDLRNAETLMTETRTYVVFLSDLGGLGAMFYFRETENLGTLKLIEETLRGETNAVNLWVAHSAIPVSYRKLGTGALAESIPQYLSSSIRERKHLLDSIWNFTPHHGITSFGCVNAYGSANDAIDFNRIVKVAEDGLVTALFDESSLCDDGDEFWDPYMKWIYAKGFGPVQASRSKVIRAIVNGKTYDFLP